MVKEIMTIKRNIIRTITIHKRSSGGRTFKKHPECLPRIVHFKDGRTGHVFTSTRVALVKMPL